MVTVTEDFVPAAIRSPTFETERCSASRSEFLLSLPGIARYYIRDGSEVVVQPEPGGDALDIRGYLLGNIFAVLCHQRRLLPLHASAVRMGDGVVAFLADSGMGKSTLAAFLGSQGYSLVADDICLLDPDASPDERVIPVAPWLKLWRNSLEALGKGEEGLTRTFHDEDKFRLPTTGYAAVQSGRLPLHALIVLENKSDAAGITLTALSPVQTVVEAMRFTYQQYLLEWLGVKEEHFTLCGRAIGLAKGYMCSRPWGFAHLPLLMEELSRAYD